MLRQRLHAGARVRQAVVHAVAELPGAPAHDARVHGCAQTELGIGCDDHATRAQGGEEAVLGGALEIDIDRVEGVGWVVELLQPALQLVL